MRIILASASPRRRELLSQLGVEFEVCPSQGEEKITEHLPGAGSYAAGAAESGRYCRKDRR